MKNQFLSKAVPRGTRTIWRYLSALILLFSLSIGQMWADLTAHVPGVYEKTVATGGYGCTLTTVASGENAGTFEVYYFSAQSKYSENTTVYNGGTKQQYRLMCADSDSEYQLINRSGTGTFTASCDWIEMAYATTGFSKSDYTFGSNKFNEFFEITPNGGNTGITKTCYIKPKEGDVLTLKVSGYVEFTILGNDNGSSKYMTVTVDGGTPTSWKSNTLSRRSVALTTGEHTIVVANVGNSANAFYGFSLKLPATPSCSTEITTQPSGATLAVGDANPELSIVATNVASYAWKESSDGTSYDGASSLGSSASFTPSVNDAIQTKYYYCEVTSSCDGAAVSKSDIVTVNVVGAISYYTVTLNPAGGTIVDATGWTLNAGNYEKEVAEGTVLTLPTFTKTDRAFKTWRKAGPADVASPVTVDGDLSLTAIWTATIEQVIYSWEGAEGGAIETGGTASSSTDGGSSFDDAQINVKQAETELYCLQINGNNSFGTNLVQITLAGEEKVKSGDKIKYWGFYSKSSNANARPKMRDANGSNASIFDDPNNLPNLYNGGDPAERTFTVPAGINTSAVQITRSQTGSNTWISKLQIIREVQVEEGDLLTVTFNTNGGSSIAPVMLASGQKVAKPADPTKAHCRFAGWQLSGSAYDFSSAVTSNITLDATWTQLYTVTYAKGATDATGTAPTQDELAAGEKFEVAANTFTYDGHDFSTWNDGLNNFDPGMEYTMGSANVTLTAQWITAVDKYTVHYMDEDGTTPLGADELVAVGQKPAGIPATKPLFAFAAWQLSGSDIALDDASWTSVAANAEVTLTARWTKAYATDIDFEAFIDAHGTSGDWGAELADKNYAISSTTSVTLDAPSGKPADKGLKIKNSGAYISFNVNAGKLVILKAGVLSGAEISVDGGANYTALTGATGSTAASVTSYHYNAAEAEYRIRTTTGSYNIIQAITITNPFQVTFNANGGDPVTAQHGTPSVTLPSASKGTDSFVGWFDGETKVGEAGDTYTPTANIELVAHWEAVSTDTRINALTYAIGAGSPVDIYEADKNTFNIALPYAQSYDAITVAATPNHASASIKSGASLVVSSLPGAATFTIVAQSGAEENYTVNFSMAPKDGVSIIKVATTGGTNKTVTGLYAGDGDVNLSSNTKMDKYKFIGFTLDGTTLQAGDRINVHTTTAASTEGSHIIFYDNMTDKNELYETGEIGGTGDNIFEINAAMVGSATAYVYRSNADAAHQWNGYVDFIEVTRAMNPVLTAIQFNSTDVAVTGTSVSATLPNGTNLGTMTVTPTIVWNGPGTAAVTGSWAWGANTYVVTDKDGDATTYTITLTEDELKYIVSFNTHGGSAIDPVAVVAGEKLAAAPADPTKDDYTFQGWSLTDGGAIIDITDVTIDENKTFHAVWAAETGVIKLLDGEGNVNTTDFITGVTAGTVNFDDEDHNCASFGSTGGDIIGKDGAGKFIVYNSKTTQTKIKFVLYNTNSSPKQITLQKLVEGADDTEDVVIDVPSQERFETPYYTFNNTANRTMYAWTNSTSVKVLQVKVVDDGTPVKQAGEVGYSLNLNLGRVFAPANMAVEYDGLAFEASSNYKVLNSTELQTKKNISFTVASPVTLVLESTGAKYQVSTDAAGSGDEYAAGTNEHDLTAGTWHIVPTTTSNMKFASISFTAPKCEKPVIATIADVDLCEGDAFTALVASASVSDGGTLHYAWFKEAGATDEAVGTDAASFTPDADGEYYVIVTNQKDGFADNTETSNVVTVQHLAGTTITTAPVSVRKDAGEAATLTVVAAGKNLAYEWFTCNADGTGAVAVDPAATEASLDVIVPDGEQYYKVVVTGDCGTVEAIAKVEKWVELTQQDVTETTFWDFSKTGVSGNVTIPVTEEEPVKLLANIPGVNNNELFRSDNIVAGSGKLTTGYIQTQKLSFHATVPGYITVSFSNTGNKENYRYLVVNGVETSAGSKNGTVISYSCAVPAGDVELTVTEADGGKMFNFRSLKFEKMDYYRETRPGYYGTICLEHGGKVYGAALYEVAYFDGADKIFFDEIVDGTMVPGMPYIFLPEGDGKALAVAYSEEAPAAVALSKNGLHGSYEKAELDPDDGNYILLNNQYVFVNTTNVFVGANRAYIRLEEIGTTPFAPAPGRRRISMGVSGESQAQGFENLDASEKPMKVMIDGQMYILRGEKVFDATGRLVK